MTTDAPFLLLETDPDGTVMATGQRSYWDSRSHDSSTRLHPLDRLNVSGTASWLWDGSQLLARTSDTGWLPLYYTWNGDRFAISPSLLLLRERFASNMLDWSAITILLALGHFIEDDTPFCDIRALPIRSTLSWRKGALVIEERSFDVPHLDISYDEAKVRYRAELAAAIERAQPKDGFVLGLSGGRDSRHILLELRELGITPRKLITSTHYLPTSEADTASAVLLAGRLGLSLTIVESDADRVRAEIQKNELVEFQTLEHSWSLRLAAEVSPSDTLYDGMEPAALFGRSPPVRHLRSHFGEEIGPAAEVMEVLIRYSFDRPIERVLNLLSESPITEDVLHKARRRVVESIMKYSTMPNLAQAFRYLNHTPRDSAMFAYGIMPAHHIVCPFDDPSMVRFGLGLPWHISSNPNLQSDAIREGYPAFSDVPFYWESPNAAQEPNWDPHAESDSAAQLAEIHSRVALPTLNPGAEAAFLSGTAPLRDLQIITFLFQLVSWNSTQRDLIA